MTFNDEIGCGNNATFLIIDLGDRQCLIYYIFSYYMIVFGVFGLIIQSYIIFSYNFRKYEPFIPTQLLIMGIALFDMVCCIGLILLFTAENYPDFNSTVSCSFYFAFAAFDENAVYLMVLLMTANRYYTICRPVREYIRVFSTYRVKTYIVGVFLFSLISAIFNHLNYCIFIRKIKDVGDFERIFQITTLTFYILFFGLVLLLIIAAYAKICLTLREQIRGDEIMNNLYSDPRDEGIGPLDDDLEMERSYFKAIVIFSIIAIPLLCVQFVAQVRARLHLISTGLTFQDGVDPLDFTAVAVTLGFFSTLFLLNPVIFYLTNEDFKVKLKRPMRVVHELAFPGEKSWSEILATNSDLDQ